MNPAEVELLADVLADRLSKRPPAPHLIDARAAGVQLGVPYSWLLAEARANRVPHVRLGKYVRFDPAALAAWAEVRMQGPRAARRGA